MKKPRTMAQAYREGVVLANGRCPIEAGFFGFLVDNECRHGHLPDYDGDACDCWKPNA